jgi:hypothetical protein
MKKLLGSVKNSRRNKLACTVSASALMLGVSHAAVVGLNFQVTWSDLGAPAYTGFPVTAAAFGVPAASWENLTPMDTGYASGFGLPGPFYLTETIDATNNSGGLNPLPNGSLTVSWQANAANNSSYGLNDPDSYGPDNLPNQPHRGEQEVYYGFMRDNVFLYTSPSPVIGYSVTISGLNSLFTNSQYAVRLAASTDSGKVFTNAIISSLTTTTTVSYSAVFTNYYDPSVTAATKNPSRVAGVMAGLSSTSAGFSDDSITIAGAPAYDGPNGLEYNPGAGTDPGPGMASTICGVMITDKPIIAYPPLTPAELCAGGSAALTVDAFGVPPLSYQWRLNGVPIAGANSSNYTVNNVGAANAGLYDVVVTNAYGSTTSAAASIAGPLLLLAPQGNVVHDTKPGGTEQNALNHGATWLASDTDGHGTHRNGVMLFSGVNNNQITLQGATNLQSATGTLLFWMRSAGTLTASPAVSEGAMIFTGGNGYDTDQYGISIVQDDFGTLHAGTLSLATGSQYFYGFSSGVILQSSGSVSDDNWHLIALTFDQTTNGGLGLYIDGSLNSTNQNTFPGASTNTAWSWPAGPAQHIALGLSHKTNWRPYDGELSDFRIYNRILLTNEISRIYTNNALVDTNALQVQLSFAAPPVSGYALSWTCGLLQSAATLPGPFNDIGTASSPWIITASQPQQFYRTR